MDTEEDALELQSNFKVKQAYIKVYCMFSFGRTIFIESVACLNPF